MSLLRTIADDYSLAERQSWLRAVPVYELVDADFATSRSGNCRMVLPMRRFSLLADFRFITCGLQPQVHPRMNMACPGSEWRVIRPQKHVMRFFWRII